MQADLEIVEGSMSCGAIPYHTIPSAPPWPRFATNNAEAK